MSALQKGVIQWSPVKPPKIVGTFSFPGNPPTKENPRPIQTVMVKRPHTTPARLEMVVGVSRTYQGKGFLRRSGTIAAIQWFDSATGGNPIAFIDDVWTLEKDALNGGFHLFGESDTPSDTMNDYMFTLKLTGGPEEIAEVPAAVSLTAVLLTLDVFPPGPTTGSGVPESIPEPPTALPVPGTATDKWFLGRTVTVQDSVLSQARARISVRQVKPKDFAGKRLSICQRSLSDITLGRSSARAALFDADRVPPPALSPPPASAHPNPFVFDPPGEHGREFFVEGRALSAARRDVAFQLGFENGEPDGDRVAFTVGVGCSISIGNPLRAVLVKKAPASPARQVVTLRTNVAFARTGTFDVTAGNVPTKVQFFAAAKGGVALALPLAVPGARLSSAGGLQLFAEGIARSGAADELVLTLALSDGDPPAGLPATAKLTAVEVTLDVFLSRPLTGGEAPLMPTADKVAIGRFVQVVSPTASHERVRLIVRPPKPNLDCKLVLKALGKEPVTVKAFAVENVDAGQEVVLPERISSSTAEQRPFDRFAEGVRPSATLRDTGFQLGIDTIDGDGDRVPMTALEFAVASRDEKVAFYALPAVRFGLWDQAYDAGPPGSIAPGLLRDDFIDNDWRRFHFHLRGPTGFAKLRATWRTVNADRRTNDDAPTSLKLTLSAPAGGGWLVSRGVLLVTNDTDAKQATPSGLVPPLKNEPRARGRADHRIRRGKIDGFVFAEAPIAPGQIHRLQIPIFDRSVPFDIRSQSVVGPGIAVVVPTKMRGCAATGARWEIKVGSVLSVDTGAAREDVKVTAVTADSFTATFAQAHNGSGAAFRIDGRTDERRRVPVRVVRYLSPANKKLYKVATDEYIRGEFRRANQLWNQVGIQIDAAETVDRKIPEAALDPKSKLYTGELDNLQEQAVLGDLWPSTPDNTLSVVFMNIQEYAGMAVIDQRAPFPLATGGTETLGDRFFIFMDTKLRLNGNTLAHEFHHVLFNRGDTDVPGQFFTFNTEPATIYHLALPNVRVQRRIHNRYSANPDIDPNNANVINWARRERTARHSVGDLIPTADATTGNTFTQEF